MSRSYKKHPVVTQTNCKWAKKDANNKVRNVQDLGNGNQYKKYYCSWDICDYKFWVNLKDEFWGNPKFFRK